MWPAGYFQLDIINELFNTGNNRVAINDDIADPG
jgi:hypothetical protein